MNLRPGDVIRHNTGLTVTGRVVRLEGEWAVVKWDAGRTRLTTILASRVHASRRPRAADYSLVVRSTGMS